jgi:Ca2+-binding EF-hand superfamily protein
MSEDEIEKVLEEADIDRDGKVSFEEFVLLMINK